VLGLELASIPLNEILDVTAFLISMALLSYSAYSDLKTREVSDWVWIVFLPAASVLLGLRLFLNSDLLTISVISILATSTLSFIMLRLGMFGGADAKAFICLSVALPNHPLPSIPPLTFVNPIFPLVVLYNAYLFSLSVAIYCLIKNFGYRYRRGKKLFKGFGSLSPLKRLMALVTGYKVRFEDLRGKVYLYPMEEVTADSESRRLKLFIDAEADRDMLIKMLGTSTGDEEEVWVSPGIPLLFFAWAALISSTLVGDILFWMVFQVFSKVL